MSSIPLAVAARTLNLDPAVLRRWIKREGIVLSRDPADRRQRLMREEDFARLVQERQTSHALTAKTGVDALEHGVGDKIDALRQSFHRTMDASNSHLAALVSTMSDLQERIARMEERLTAASSSSPDTAVADESPRTDEFNGHVHKDEDVVNARAGGNVHVIGERPAKKQDS